MMVLFFVMHCLPAKGQSFKEGYIVTNEDDTLKGLTKKDVSASLLIKLRFKDNTLSEEKEFLPDQVKSFLCGTNLFVSRTTSTIDGVSQKVFMQVMAQGYLSCYEFEHKGSGTRNTYKTVDNVERFVILQKQNENIQFVAQVNHITLSFKKRIVVYLKDDPALCKKIKKGIYTRSDILKIVNEYNSKKNWRKRIN